MRNNPQKPKRQPRNTQCAVNVGELATTKARTLEWPTQDQDPAAPNPAKSPKYIWTKGPKP